MFMPHITDFNATPATRVPQMPQSGLVLSRDTLLETANGWKPAAEISKGEAVARLDGGFARVTGHARSSLSGDAVRVPAGVLGACSDVVLPVESYVGVTPPAQSIHEAPCVSLPASALIGYRGIRAAQFGHDGGIVLALEDEEMVWAQTGMLLHATTTPFDPFYSRLGYGEARGLLALLDPAHCGPDASFAM